MSAPEPNYVHRATLMEAHDGDTFRLRLDLGTYAGVRVDPVVLIRLRGIDCWELDEPGGRGRAAQAYAQTRLAGARLVTVGTERPEGGPLGQTFARTVARVWVDGEDLADALRARGHEKGAP